MKMQARLLAGVLACASLCMLVSCGAHPNAAAGSAPASAAQESGAKADSGGSSGANITVVSSADLSLYGSGTEEGYYYFLPNGSNAVSGNLRYIDYATGQDVYLSASPNANHNDPSDTSYIDSTVGGYKVFPVGDKLYFMRNGSQVYNEIYGELALPAITKMELDGSNHETLWLGESTDNVENIVASDGESLYLFANRVLPGGDGSYLVLRIDRNSGECTTLASLPQGTMFRGASKDRLFFVKWEERENRSHGTLIAVDGHSGEVFDDLKQWDEGETGSVYLCFPQEAFCMLDDTTKKLSVYDPDTMEKTAEFDLPAESGEILYAEVWDDKLFLWSCPSDDGPSDAWVIDWRTGAAQRSTLLYYNADKLEDKPVEVVEETAQDFLVCIGLDTTPVSYDNGDGTSITVDWPTTQYALISKQDYYNNVENYRRIG